MIDLIMNSLETTIGGNERDRMNTIAPHAPYIVSGIAPPRSSPAANWYSNLGKQVQTIHLILDCNMLMQNKQ